MKATVLNNYASAEELELKKMVSKTSNSEEALIKIYTATIKFLYVAKAKVDLKDWLDLSFFTSKYSWNDQLRKLPSKKENKRMSFEFVHCIFLSASIPDNSNSVK
jgi:hypothetical protein